MLSADFNIQTDIIGLTDLRKNLAQIVEDIEETGSQKVIIRKGKPSVVVMSVADFQAVQDRLLAMELQEAYRQTKAEEARGELLDLDDLAAEFGFSEADFPDIARKPENYDSMIPASAKSRERNGKK
jgi:prevent-host-death family protein